MVMIIKILGTGCPKCKKLEENVREAVTHAGIAAEVQKVTGVGEIMKYNVVLTPALVVDEVVMSSGKVLSPEEIRQMLTSGR